MSVKQRGKIWFFDFTIDGARYRGSTGQSSKAAALRVEARERERAKLGDLSRPVLTLESAADKWFAAKVAGQRSEVDTAKRIVIMLRHIPAHTNVSDIDSALIAEAMADRRVELHPRKKRPPSNSTVNRDLIDHTLRPILRYAHRVLLARVQPIAWSDLRLPEPRGRERTFTPQELAAWLSKLPPEYHPVHAFIRRYGVRLSEAFFPLDGFDAEQGRAIVRKRKNGRPHVVDFLPEDARDLAARYGRARDAGLDTVWFREGKHRIEALTPAGFASASRAALDAAGIKDARPSHDLRHHAASTLLRAPGASLAMAKELLGHESIVSTSRYVHVQRADILTALSHTGGTETVLEAKKA